MSSKSSSMCDLTGGQAAVKALQAESTELVFGLIGSAAMELYDALYDASDIRFVGVHDERTGVHIADGYARASGKPGIIIAGQNGPGATNLVTGIAQAKAAYSPVISIAGALSTEHVYRDAFQEVDQQALFSPITKKTWTITQTSRVDEIFREAFRIALTPRKGPVQINLPRDVLSQTAAFSKFESPHSYRAQTVAIAPDDQIAQAARLLALAKRPVIVAGGGIKNSGGHKETLQLAEALNAPIATSPGHGDAIPFAHPLNAGQMGPRGNPVASGLVNQADVILALGTRLGFNSTFFSYENINQEAKIIQVEQEVTAIGRYFPVTLGIWGDAPSIASQIVQAVHKSEFVAQVENWTEACKRDRAAYLDKRDSEVDFAAHPISPPAVFKVLRDVLPKSAAFTLDAGTLCLQATDALNYHYPPALFTPLDFGLIGFSFACGLGVKLAMPERPVISLMGDGGFGMTLSELSTAADCEINTVTIVLNNQCWGAEKAYQRDFFDERYIGADISSPPFDKIANLYGCFGIRVERTADLGDAVMTALDSDKPAVIDVAVDPSALYSFRTDSFAHRKSK